MPVHKENGTNISFSGSCDPEWKSPSGETCDSYAEKSYCTAKGEYGSEWKAEWGTFQDWAVDGQGASVCPQCGCEGKIRQH